MNKKNIFIAASIIGLAIYYFSPAKDLTEHSASIQGFKMSQPKVKLVKSSAPKLDSATRDPASAKRVPSGINERKFRKSRPKVTKYESRKVNGLPVNMSLAKNIFAQPENEFSGSTDRVVLEKMGMIFFESQVKPTNTTLVAVEDHSGKLYPISSVIKLENIGPDKRRQLMSQGLEEHYYHAATNVMFIQSSPDELLRLNEELQSQSLEPELEVMKGFHQVR